jgi:hypothetical protein
MYLVVIIAMMIIMYLDYLLYLIGFVYLVFGYLGDGVKQLLVCMSLLIELVVFNGLVIKVCFPPFELES